MVLDDYRYATKEGNLPFEASFTTQFIVQETPSGTTLRIEQAGFPEREAEFWDACMQGWKDTFAGIRSFCDS